MTNAELIELLKEARQRITHSVNRMYDHSDFVFCTRIDDALVELEAQKVKEPVDSTKNVVESEAEWKRYDREQTSIFNGVWMNVWFGNDKMWYWRVGLLSGFKPTEAEAKSAAIRAVKEMK